MADVERERARAEAAEAKLAEAERALDALKMANISNVTRRDRAEARVEALEKALRGLYELIDDGTLVRDTASDHKPTWLRGMARVVAALKAADAALAAHKT